MEKDKHFDYSYDYYLYVARLFAQEGDSEKAGQVIEIMRRRWPQRVFGSKHQSIDSKVLDEQLEGDPSVP